MVTVGAYEAKTHLLGIYAGEECALLSVGRDIAIHPYPSPRCRHRQALRERPWSRSNRKPRKECSKEILSLARENRLSTYDASYLDLAMRLGLPISTKDRVLLKAAKKCQIPAFAPSGSPWNP